MPRTIDFVVTSEYDGMKLFRFLRGGAKLSSRLVSSLKHYDNGIMRSGLKIRTIDKVKAGDVITITLPDDETGAEPIESQLDILYEDNDLLIVNKPAMLAMHPTHNHQGDTLANAVSWHLKKEGKTAVFRSVGRLDKGTSGVVVCALNRYSAARLSGNIQKEYLAVVTKEFTGEGTINVPIYRPDPMKTLRASGHTQGAESAVTHWQSIKSGKGISLLRVWLDTGRTHRIRVHFAHLGAPLLGDTMYGDANSQIGHQLLHCHKASFIHPTTNEPITVAAKIPHEFSICDKYVFL
ncbi:MAG: RluA family pseudouridine synthase [Clostridiales bacterium]|nr:RluA family pseudouridine synthase [Clostridiales bacterium]